MWADLMPWGAAVGLIIAIVGAAYRIGRSRGEDAQGRDDLERRVREIERGQREIWQRIRDITDRYLRDGGAIQIHPSRRDDDRK